MEKDRHKTIGLAPAEEAQWRRHYATFAGLYKGRSDAVAVRKDGEYEPVSGGGLTFERFLEHIGMQKTYAVYNKDDVGMVSFGLFDVDIFPRNQGWEKLLLSMDEKKKETALIMGTLMDLGLERNNMLIEFPTVGFHLLIFFAQPVPATTLKALMSFVLRRSGLDKIPSYPRNVTAAYGDCVQLPLRINLNTSRRSNFIYDLESFDPQNYAGEPDFAVLERVVPIPSAWLAQVAAAYDL